MPQKGDLATDRLVDQFAVLGLGRADILEAHQIGDPVAMIDHRLAPHLGRVGGQDRRDQGPFEQGQGRVAVDALRLQPGKRGGHVGAGLGGDAPAVLGEVGEHRKEHEAAHEGERVVEAQRRQRRLDCFLVGLAARLVDGGGANALDPLEQILAAMIADDVAEDPSEIADVGILGDRRVRGHGPMLHRTTSAVNEEAIHPSVRAAPRLEHPHSPGDRA